MPGHGPRRIPPGRGPSDRTSPRALLQLPRTSRLSRTRPPRRRPRSPLRLVRRAGTRRPRLPCSIPRRRKTVAHPGYRHRSPRRQAPSRRLDHRLNRGRAQVLSKNGTALPAEGRGLTVAGVGDSEETDGAGVVAPFPPCPLVGRPGRIQPPCGRDRGKSREIPSTRAPGLAVAPLVPACPGAARHRPVNTSPPPRASQAVNRCAWPATPAAYRDTSADYQQVSRCVTVSE